MPLLPLTLAAGREPTLAAWLPLLACFSMFPLLVRDGVGLPYVAAAAVYGAVMAGAALQQARQLQVGLGEGVRDGRREAGGSWEVGEGLGGWGAGCGHFS